MLMGGTLASFIALSSALSGWCVVDISAHCWVLKEQTFFPGKKTTRLNPQSYRRSVCFWSGAELVVWSCVLFENCTVDASIFVSKCLRAYGGCLGTRSR